MFSILNDPYLARLVANQQIDQGVQIASHRQLLGSLRERIHVDIGSLVHRHRGQAAN